MLIPVLTEPNFRSYLWARQTMEGIQQEVAKRKYRMVSLNGEAYENFDYDSLFGEERRMLIVIGTSISWMPYALDFFNRKNIETVFISYDPSEEFLPTGMVRMDYMGGIHRLVHYLRACGRDQIAMYGYNPNSSADNLKLRYFDKVQHAAGYTTEGTAFMNYADLRACYESFREKVHNFNSVICANDIVGVSLLSFLKRDGIRVPEELFVTAFGDSLISARVSPSLTTATLNHREMGRQAVIQFSTLCRQPATANLSVRVKSHLIVRESTMCMPDSLGTLPPLADEDADNGNVDFYSDSEAARILRAEALFNACDETDIRYMQALLDGVPVETMKAKLYLTGSALQYRKKCLTAASECTNSEELMDFLRFCRSKGIL